MRAAFQAAHRARFGFDPGDAALVIEAAEAEAVGAAADLTEPALPEAARPEARDRGGAGRAGLPRRRLGRGAVRAARGAAPGDRLSGPAVLVEPHTSILVEPGWRARITAHDHVELARVEPRPRRGGGRGRGPTR